MAGSALFFFSLLHRLGSSSILDKETVISLTVFFTLLCACIVIGHLLEENRWANESITALLLGLCAGLVVLLVTKGQSSRILNFSEELFFIYLLPPIIFNAGFQVKKKQFFRNFSTILLFGALGTLISFCLISLGAFFLLKRIGLESLRTQDYLAVGAILSATDSVCTLQVLSQDETPLLYSLVFGEGVVNDATSIVLFNAVQTLDLNSIDAFLALKLFGTFLYLFLTSTALGVAVGLISAYLIKTLYFGRHYYLILPVGCGPGIGHLFITAVGTEFLSGKGKHSTDREVAVMMLMAYLSYMLAELLSLSGILTIFFCGIVMSHYTWHNVTESSRITTKHAFATISFVAETFIFLYVGMDALDIDKWKASHTSAGISIVISLTLLALVLVGRAAFVFLLANIANYFKKRENTKITLRQQFIIWWAGLMRGAVTIALSYNQFTGTGSTSTSTEDRARMITCTIIIVLFSTVVFGSITTPLIDALLLRHSKSSNMDASELPSFEELHISLLEEGGPSGEGGQQVLPKRSNLSLLISHPTSTVHHFWRKFDDRFMRPVFGGRGFVPFVPSSPTGAEIPSSPPGAEREPSQA